MLLRIDPIGIRRNNEDQNRDVKTSACRKPQSVGPVSSAEKKLVRWLAAVIELRKICHIPFPVWLWFEGVKYPPTRHISHQGIEVLKLKLSHPFSKNLDIQSRCRWEIMIEDVQQGWSWQYPLTADYHVIQSESSEGKSNILLHSYDKNCSCSHKTVCVK